MCRIYSIMLLKIRSQTRAVFIPKLQKKIKPSSLKLENGKKNVVKQKSKFQIN